MIKGKSPEEIRKTFNIQNDFTPEEEDQIRRENEWAEEYVLPSEQHYHTHLLTFNSVANLSIHHSSSLAKSKRKTGIMGVAWRKLVFSLMIITRHQ